MAHEIQKLNGKHCYVYNGEEGAGWHGLGEPIPAEFAKDPRKIAELCGASYNVYKAQTFFRQGGEDSGMEREIANRFALVRDDTHTALEVLSDNKYNIVQPVEYFEAFRDSLAANNLVISSAGVLKGGRVVFVCAKFTDQGFDVLGLDRTDVYVCLGGGYDGNMSSFGYLSKMRTVCNNTLSANVAMKIRETKNSKVAGKGFFRMPHSVAFDGAALTGALGLAGKELQVTAQVFNELARAKVDLSTAARYFAEVMDIDPEIVNAVDKNGKALLSTRSKNQLEAIAGAYLGGPGAQLATANGTWYGALNAVTHYVDHMAATRDSYGDGKGAARFASAQFGAGNDLKTKALELAIEKAGIDQDLRIAA